MGTDPYRPPRRSRPPRRHGHASAGRTFLWLVLFVGLAVVVVWFFAGSAIRDAVGGGGSEAAAPVVTEPPLTPFTIPEGLRREDVAALIDQKLAGKGIGMTGAAYMEATKASARGRRLARTGRPTSLEGFLFPATYDIGTETTIDILVDAQVREYEARTSTVNYRPAARRNLTEYDVLIIASMIEREAAVAAERPVIASVIYNRLKAGMPLQIDATVQYALGDWRTELTSADLEVDSPYNTYQVTGLPPGPICNPGEAAIQAAARPATTSYLYYVTKKDGTGEHYFSTNPDDFQADFERSLQNSGDQ